MKTGICQTQSSSSSREQDVYLSEDNRFIKSLREAIRYVGIDWRQLFFHRDRAYAFMNCVEDLCPDSNVELSLLRAVLFLCSGQSEYNENIVAILVRLGRIGHDEAIYISDALSTAFEHSGSKQCVTMEVDWQQQPLRCLINRKLASESWRKCILDGQHLIKGVPAELRYGFYAANRVLSCTRDEINADVFCNRLEREYRITHDDALTLAEICGVSALGTVSQATSQTYNPALNATPQTAPQLSAPVVGALSQSSQPSPYPMEKLQATISCPDQGIYASTWNPIPDAMTSARIPTPVLSTNQVRSCLVLGVLVLLFIGGAISFWWTQSHNPTLTQKEIETSAITNKTDETDMDIRQGLTPEDETGKTIPPLSDELVEHEQRASLTDIYLLPTDTRYITGDDLSNLTRQELMLARNEIYARHGYDFQDEVVRSYFDNQRWYHPQAGLNGVSFDESVLNLYEQKNRDTIKQYEAEYDRNHISGYISVDYILPTDRQYISTADLSQLTSREVMLARNEIYARHGYDFQQKPVRDYFNQKSWYHPVSGMNGSSFEDSVFNQYERTNLEVIQQYEKENG